MSPGAWFIVRVGAVVSLAILCFFLAADRARIALPGKRGVPEEREDPLARERYEWLRQRDPATGKVPDDVRARELRFARTLRTRESLRDVLQKDGNRTAATEEISWTHRGPLNVGGRTRALAIDITNPSVILAGGVSGGMWRSTDAGASWVKTTAPEQLHSVTCIVQDVRPGKSGIWYYGTGELVGNSASGEGGAIYRGDGIFKSTDGGRTWAQLPSTVTGTPQVYDQMFDYVWNLAIDTSSPFDELYAATIGGINRSTNGGASWTAVLGGQASGNSRFSDLVVTSSGVVYAALSDARLDLSPGSPVAGVWRSTDGVQWVNIRPTIPPWPTASRRIVMGIAPSNENIVYFLGETPGDGFQTIVEGSSEWNSFWKYTYLSGNGAGAGGAWEDRSANLPGFGSPVGDFLSQGSYNLVVKVSPLNENLVFIGGTNLYRSTNGFKAAGATSWIGGYATKNDISLYPSHHCDQHALVFSRVNAAVLYSGTDGGVFRTDDCAANAVSWTSLNNGYFTTQFYTLAIDHQTAGSPVIIGGMQDNGTWFTGAPGSAVPWVDILGGDGAFCAVASNRSSYYVSYQEGGTYRVLLDGAGNMQNYARVDPQGGSGYLFVNPFILDPSNENVMYLAAGTDLWRNSNLLGIPLRSISADADNPTSVNWMRMSGSSVTGALVSALGASKTAPPSRLYLGTTNGRVFRLDGALTAAPASVALDIGTGKGFPAGSYVSCIGVDPTNGDNALLVFSNYSLRSLFYTTNAGGSWTDVSGNLEQFPDGSGAGPSVRWAAMQTYGGGPRYFVGTSTGLYTADSLAGSSTVWVQEGTAMIGRVVVDMIDVRSSDGLVAVATHGQGVFTGTSQPVGPPPGLIPLRTSLEQNFPNPFNPFTTIRFTLAGPGLVSLRVYSVAGEEVAPLVNEQRPAGRQPDVYWYPGSLASGVYFYEMRSGEYREAKKLLYLK